MQRNLCFPSAFLGPFDPGESATALKDLNSGSGGFRPYKTERRALSPSALPKATMRLISPPGSALGPRWPESLGECSSNTMDTTKSKFLWDVFLSPSSVQKPLIRAIVEQWRELDLSVFFDEDTIQPGEDRSHRSRWSS